MGFVLVLPSGPSMYVNVWTWGTVVELLRRYQVIERDERGWHALRTNSGHEVTPDEAMAIGDFLDSYLEGRSPQERLLLDLSVTSEPDTGEFYRDEKDFGLNYSASIVWLRKFRAFCWLGTGFKVLPFLYLVLLAEQIVRRLAALANPILRTEAGAVAIWINLALLALLLIGLVLSLWSRRAAALPSPVS